MKLLRAEFHLIFFNNMKFQKNNTFSPFSLTENNNFPQEVILFQNYPNPFSTTTFISFIIPETINNGNNILHVTLKVFDSGGNEISTLMNDERSPGYYEIEYFSGDLPDGIYYYELIVGSYYKLTKRMSLVR